jgi:CRP-like cAMP-binding protein
MLQTYICYLTLNKYTVEVYQQLYLYLRQFTNLTDEDFELLKKSSQLKNFRKKELLIKAGNTEQHLYFIAKGLVREYFVKDKQQVTTDIITEGTITGGVSSFFTMAPSNYSLEAMEPVAAIAIERNKLELLYKSDVKWERFGRIITTHFLLQQELHILNNIQYTVRERFFHFMNNHPDLLQRVPQKYLASYLNIKPETFSRLKSVLLKKMAKKI